MSYKTTDIVKALREFERCVTAEELASDPEGCSLAMMRFMAQRFPKVTGNELHQAFAVYKEEKEFEAAERERQVAFLERDAELCDRAGLPEGTRFEDALRHLAAQGDAEAAGRLRGLTSSESETYMRLFRAAAAAHPAWMVEADGSFTRADDGDHPKEPDALIEWFQINHSREARQLEGRAA